MGRGTGVRRMEIIPSGTSSPRRNAGRSTRSKMNVSGQKIKDLKTRSPRISRKPIAKTVPEINARRINKRARRLARHVPIPLIVENVTAPVIIPVAAPNKPVKVAKITRENKIGRNNINFKTKAKKQYSPKAREINMDASTTGESDGLSKESNRQSNAQGGIFSWLRRLLGR